MKTVHFNILILSEDLCRWRNHLSLRIYLNHTLHLLMNVSPSWSFVFSLDQRFREINFHHFSMNSYLHKNISFTGCPIIYPFKYKYICEYDTIFIMSSGLIFYDIMMNIIRNKILECHKKEDDCFFTNISNNNIYMYRGSLQYFYWKKGHTSV